MDNQKAQQEKQKSTTNAQSIAYEGRVTVKIKSGNRIISSQTLPNHGQLDLFKFIAHAFAGRYLSNDRPAKLQLFTIKSENPTPEAFDITGEGVTNLTEEILYSTDPQVISNSDSSFAQLQWNIPYSLVPTSEGGIYGFKLWSFGGDKLLAYYLCTGGEGFVPIELDTNEASQDYTLTVEWQLSIANK